MTAVLHLDFEGGSAADLRSCGLHRYAEDPSTRLWCLAWAFDDGEQGVWKPGEYFPQRVLDHAENGGRVVAHNAPFERTIWNQVLTRELRGRVFVPPMRIEQMDDTMARCATLAIPARLEDAGHVLGIKQQKDKTGHANMLVLAKPKKIHPDGRIEWNDTPERLAMQYAYCAQDVAAETEIDRTVPPLSARERQVWELDQRINDRGIMLDIDTIKAAGKVVAAEKQRLDAELAEATGGAVAAVTQAIRMRDWIAARGVPCTGLGKDVMAKLLRDAAGDPAVLKALAIRKEGAKSSTAKLGAMLACVCKDGRARGLLAYHGAHTGRWAGRLIQPQNLYRTDPDEDGDDIHQAIAVLQGAMTPERKALAIKLLTGSSAMVMIAKCLRSMFIAPPGRRFVGGDLSNIEGRVAAWITGEHWKVEAFRAYDEKRGPDLYRVAYARSFGVDDPADVTGVQRQVGKVQELSLQYQGSIGAFLKMLANNPKAPPPAELAAAVREAVGANRWAHMAGGYKAASDKHGLPQDEWAAIKLIVAGWREAHPNLVQGWWDLQDAAIEAVASPGAVVPVLDGKVRYVSSRGFLWCSLPSGRVLAYFQPRVVTADTSYIEMPDGVRLKLDDLREGEREAALEEGGHLVRQTRRRVDYEGYEGERKRWATMNLYGGMQFNHIVQGTARDIMVDGMLEADRRGYPLVLTVHDELLAECPDGFGSADELASIMGTVPAWVVGDLPLAAKAWEDKRYAK